MVGPRKTERKRTPRTCFPFPLATALTVAAVLALGYLWLCSRCEVLAQSLKTLEADVKAAQVRLVNEEYKWARFSSPRSVEAALARFNLPLTWPTERQVVYLSRRLRIDELRPASAAVPQLARRTDGWGPEGYD